MEPLHHAVLVGIDPELQKGRAAKKKHTHTPSFTHRGLVALMPLGRIWWRAWAPLVARGAAALCVAGVALGDIHLRFAWEPSTYATGLDLVARLAPVQDLH